MPVNDTSPEMERRVRELMMNRSGDERLKMASDMFNAARTLVMASLSSQFSELEARVQLCERFYGGEVDVKAFSSALRRKESD